MPNPYSFGEVARPSQPIEYIASRPALKKQMSRVWSRCLSINRKTRHQLEVKDEDFETVLKSGHERRVCVEGGYQVVPRITSTHLTKSKGGFREVEQDIDRKYGSLSSISTTVQLPYYSHPLSESSQRRTNLPRRPSVIQPKLSRGQIAKFRNASGGSHISSDDRRSGCGCIQGNCRHRSSISENQRPPYPPTSINGQVDKSIISSQSSSSTSTIPGRGESPNSTPRNDRNKKLPNPPPSLDSKPRRHLASSRSTAEMKGRSPTPSSTPKRHNRTIKAESVSFETSTPRAGNEVRYPFVCPDKLVQRTIPQREVKKEELTPTYMYPRPAPLPPTNQHDIPPARDLARIMSYESSSPTPQPTTVDPETLERLFDEVLQACRTGDIPFTSPTNSGESVYSVHTETPYKSPGESSGDSHSRYSVEAITPGITRQRTSDIWSPSFEYDVESPNPAIRSPSVHLPFRSRVTPFSSADSKRFIPSGRSFEPLRTINIPNTAMLTGPRGEERWNKGSVTTGRVKEAIAKFESVAVSGGTPPITPIRVIGEILDRPTSTLADSHGLSQESRRLMFEARMKRLPR